MTDLDRAIAAAREALSAADESLQGNAAPSAMLSEHYDACAGCADTLRDLLAALDAARGEAVAVVNRHMLGALVPNRWIPVVAPSEERSDTDVLLYAAPPASLADVTDEYARAFHDGWLACKRGDAEPPVPAQQPAAAVPSLMDFLLWAAGWRETDEHDELTGADAVAYRVAVTIHREMLAAAPAVPAGHVPVAVSDAALDAAVKGWTLDGGIGLRDALRNAISRAAHAQQPAALAVPEGYALVPVEPTEAMVQAAFDSMEAYPLEGKIRRYYRAMLAAAERAKGVES